MTHLNDQLNTILLDYMKQNYFTGAVCLVKRGDETLYEASFGYTNRDKTQKVNPNTMFDLASLTKLFTSTLILKLITNDKLSLDTQLYDCLPATKHHPILSSITIFELLTHTSGLRAWYPFYSHSKTNLFEILCNIDLKHHKEEDVVYSDLNYILLGKVIEYQYSQPLDQVVSTVLSKYINSNSLTYGTVDPVRVAATEFGNQIEMNMCEERGIPFDQWRTTNQPIMGEVNDGNTFYFFNGVSGHAGLFGTAEDVSKLGAIYLKGGNGGASFIDDRLLKEAYQSQKGNRGLGWHSGAPFPRGVGHTGFTGTALWIVPEDQLNVTLLTNRLNVDQPKDIQPLRMEIFETIIRGIKHV
ncbi:serine hydrolase domain-containing protein [Tenuibacillus multivorans]|uniref:CubicO group peptidase, beta-lactamase class C family n=1 Tax=Tenuibacillus multivorans TaxID=237069 RepID=A0A1H0C4M0_9BACI|nr:serine hydrolase domain-containing protein [Tenuibacillus multivorans]GEL77764.1 UPF0214 protein YbbE [Tenuibacillus multivorans]SDN52824.1 CubicO group peptidase, beta-lactamase class C family [Tenuibacillus multivorans]